MGGAGSRKTSSSFLTAKGARRYALTIIKDARGELYATGFVKSPVMLKGNSAVDALATTSNALNLLLFMAIAIVISIKARVVYAKETKLMGRSAGQKLRRTDTAAVCTILLVTFSIHNAYVWNLARQHAKSSGSEMLA